MARWVTLTAALAVGLAPYVQAQQAPVDLGADRPGIGVAAAVVPPGAVQSEGGLSLSHERDGTVLTSVLVAGSPLVRAGLVRGLELRFDGDGFRSETSREAGAPKRTVRGLSDFEAGAKISLLGEKKLCPAIALLPSVSLPTGSRGLTASAVNPSLILAWSKGLPAALVAGGNLAAASIRDDRSRFWRSAESLVVGFPLAWKLGGFAEIYRLSTSERGAGTTQTFDGGISRPLGENAQVDLEAGHTLDSDRPSWFVGFGMVFRVHLPALSRRHRT